MDGDRCERNHRRSSNHRSDAPYWRGDRNRGAVDRYESGSSSGGGTNYRSKLGLVIRTLTIGHAPPTNFILVTMGSTGVLLIGWRALRSTLFPADNGKKNDVYKRVSPFELFDVCDIHLYQMKAGK